MTTSEQPASQRRENKPYLTKLDLHECRLLLAAQSVGRIGWASGSGQLILPITYVYSDAIIGFRTSSDSPLAELVRPTLVAFEVDSLDAMHNEGSSVVVQGITRAAPQPDGNPSQWSDLVVPWAGGRREVVIEIRISKITGRRVTRHPERF